LNNISKYDPNRKNVGAIYRDAQINGEKGVIIGDMNHEMMKGFVEDVNEAIKVGTKELGGIPFYVAIYEKRDLSMKQSIVRIPKVWTKRPYPEQDSTVFRVVPYSNAVYFCWSLPHHSEIRNKLSCPDLYEETELEKYRHWVNYRLEHFGFKKDEKGHWIENPFYKEDVLMEERAKKPTQIISVA
jgi:hypothetical protein